MSVDHATIGQLIEEGKQMETLTTEYMEKEIAGLKLTLEDTMKHVESQRNKINTLQSQVNRIIDNLTEDEFYSKHVSKEEVLEELCNILDYEPKKEISFYATIRVEGRYDIPMDEAEDFDLEAFLSDTLSVDAYNGDVVIDSFIVDEAQEGN